MQICYKNCMRKEQFLIVTKIEILMKVFVMPYGEFLPVTVTKCALNILTQHTELLRNEISVVKDMK